MTTLFGLPMSAIMLVLVALFAVCLGGVVALWLTNRVMVHMGLRNIPRRGAQTALVVLGLMLATLIITAAFTTGDTLNHSITSTTFDALQRIDLGVTFNGAGDSAVYPNQSALDTIDARFGNDPDVEGVNGYLQEGVPALNPRTRLSEPLVMLSGIDLQRQGRLGGLRLSDGPGTHGAGPGTRGAGGRADLTTLGENQVLISNKLADKLDARQGDTVSVFAQRQQFDLQVAGIVEDEIADGVTSFGPGVDQAGGMAAPIATVQRITNHPGQFNLLTFALKGGVRGSLDRTDAAFPRIESYLHSADGKQALGVGDLDVKVEKFKKDSVHTAELVSSLFTTLFLVLGLFSIAAGVMLIFLIFVMLAAERRTEMGIARAIGARRANLVQMFVAEGMAYNLLAGLVGAALGVAVAFGLIVGGSKLVFGDSLSFVHAYVTPRSLIISYCLGAVLTFITVVISSMRISRLNIVAAVRGVDDVQPRESKRDHSWKWVLISIPLLIPPITPLGLWCLLRRGIGLPSNWVWGPIGGLAGIGSILLAYASNAQFFFSMGVSLLPLSIAGIVRYYGADRRLTWSVVGAVLAVYWLLPFQVTDKLQGRQFDANVEMFVLSGIMVVTAMTLLIVFNARWLTALFERGDDGARAYTLAIELAAAGAAAAGIGLALGDRGDGLGQLMYLLAGLLLITAAGSAAAARFPRLAPALKMAVAYPLASRFRTGMTVAMFSLIVFSLTVFGIINANFDQLFATDDARGGWDIQASTNRNNPVPDLRAALQTEGSFDTKQITDVGRLTPYQGRGSVEVRQAGGDPAWKDYPVRAADADFLLKSQAKLDGRAAGYEQMSDAQVFAAVQNDQNLAVIDKAAFPSNNNNGGDFDFHVKGVKITNGTFTPFEIEFRDPVSGKSGKVTVVGVLSGKIPPIVVNGLITNESTYAQVFGTPQYLVNYVRLAPGVNGKTAAKGIKAALVTQGVQATSIQERIDDNLAQQKGFTRIFQAFMALGLFVGIAALGVIAFRSVVERRQQIGMLRAIGYQRGTVALTFLLESSFIALMGIGSGVVGACILARNLMTSDSFTDGSKLTFFIPWSEVVLFAVAAYLFALLMTWWPSRGAARVPIAEALRYE